MRVLNDYAKVCMAELDAIGVPYRSSRFEVNSRAVKRWGQCRSNGDGTFTIQISSVLLEPVNSSKGLKNTIIHELLHTIVGCLNHGDEWKKWADVVNSAYGYNIKRTSSAEEKGVRVDSRENRRHYEVTCKECGAMWIYYRDNKITKNYKSCRCYCGGRLKSVLVDKDGNEFVTLCA